MDPNENDRKCDKETYRDHMVKFVSTFVEKHHRERWLHFLINRPKQLHSNSAKLRNHLDRRYCIEMSTLERLHSDRMGVFCDFFDFSDPLFVNTTRAIALAGSRDALFSVVPGKLAACFFHEGTVLICRQEAK